MIAEGIAMQLKDIQTLEHAARTAMAGNDDPLPPTPKFPVAALIGVACVALIGVAWLLLV